MADSMVDSIMSLVTPQMIGSLASRFGSPTGPIETGLGTSAAAVLAAIAYKSSNSDFMNQVFNLISSSNSQSILGHLPSLVSGDVASRPIADLGSRFLSLLFEGHQTSLESLVAEESGLSGVTGSGLMAVAAPLVIGFLGQRAREMNLNASSFTDLISAERSKLEALLPEGAGDILSGASSSVPSIVSSTNASPRSAGGGKTSLIAIGLLAAGLLTWLGSRGDTKPTQKVASKITDMTSQAPTVATAAATSAVAGLGEFSKRRLPDNTDLNIPRLGVEDMLIEFIEDSSRPVDQTTWFDLNRLLFAAGRATLQPTSAEQLQNIAAILKAYPRIKIKIGGYTDNTGSKQGNLRLSEDRATNVVTKLVKLGIDPSRVESEGYGQEHPVADNATEEGRATNRRISLRVTEK